MSAFTDEELAAIEAAITDGCLTVIEPGRTDLDELHNLHRGIPWGKRLVYGRDPAEVPTLEEAPEDLPGAYADLLERFEEEMDPSEREIGCAMGMLMFEDQADAMWRGKK